MNALRRAYGLLALGWTVVAWSSLPVEPKIAITILSSLFLLMTLIGFGGDEC